MLFESIKSSFHFNLMTSMTFFQTKYTPPKKGEKKFRRTKIKFCNLINLDINVPIFSKVPTQREREEKLFRSMNNNNNVLSVSVRRDNEINYIFSFGRGKKCIIYHLLFFLFQ